MTKIESDIRKALKAVRKRLSKVPETDTTWWYIKADIEHLERDLDEVKALERS